MTPLTMIKTGQTRRIKEVLGEGEAKRHLQNLGFCAGEPVTVVSESAGNLIINVKCSRIAVDKAMACRIMT
jgi:ferrous iron transport protein A